MSQSDLMLPSLGEAASDPILAGINAYVVGGAVRDALLGITAGDRDWVVVGVQPGTMQERGFIPVGHDFPVFLHPRTKEEYALARTERKSGRGYRGFTFYTGSDVTLEDDLRRRDLTVNAIAQAPDGRLIDPLNGRADIQDRVLRHVGAAFTEDPVRLLRLARFAARFPDFSVAPETMALARQLVSGGEVDALVPERVWQELAKGLMTTQPGRMLQVLADTGALERVMPGLRIMAHTGAELACAAQRQLGLADRFAILCRHCDDPVQVAKHIRAPSDCRDRARLLPLLREQVQAIEHTEPSRQAGLALDVITRSDALRKPERFLALLDAIACTGAGTIHTADWQRALDALRTLDAGAIARAAGGKPDVIKHELCRARLRLLVGIFSSEH